MNKQVMIGSVDFSGHEEMYDNFVLYNDGRIDINDYIIYDKDNLTVWIIWYSEEVT